MAVARRTSVAAAPHLMGLCPSTTTMRLHSPFSGVRWHADRTADWQWLRHRILCSARRGPCSIPGSFKFQQNLPSSVYGRCSTYFAANDPLWLYAWIGCVLMAAV